MIPEVVLILILPIDIDTFDKLRSIFSKDDEFCNIHSLILAFLFFVSVILILLF